MDMQHLSPERIAALVDEPATSDERAHLERCARCRADFIAVRRIVAAAASERDTPIAPLLSWQQLSSSLRDEGLLGQPRSAALTVTTPDIRPIASAPSTVAASQPLESRDSHLRRSLRPWQRYSGMAAAAALLIAVGAAGGRMLGPGARVGEAVAVSPAGVAAATVPMTPVVQFRTPDDARATLHSAEEMYGGALLWLAAHDSALAPRQMDGAAAAASNYRQRLEVLDAAMATARRALYEAPDDPVMNRYYLATLGAREVTLRRLTTVLPASQQVLEY
jgi:hypothetical protein